MSKHKHKHNSRRRFLKGLFAGVTIVTFPGAARTYAANEKLNMACIGAGGQAGAGIGTALGQNLVAIAEVDQVARGKDNIAKVKKQFPDVKLYTDYRKLFDEVKGLDAVWVATPDHHHFPASIRAIEAGAGVYVEKPMAFSVWEARKMRDAAAAKKVATQMGNQGHSSQTIRILCEYIWSGVIGEVKEVHCVSNRNFTAGKRESAAIPAGLDWDVWLGPAPQRDYHKDLHPFAWRGWLDFGSGSLGDMGCHTIDGSVWALKLNEADNVEVEAELGACTEDGFPKAARIVYKFPARGDMPPLTLKWWHGGGDANLPPRPEALEADKKQQGEGAYYYGSKMTMKSGSHCGDVQIIPDAKHRETPKPAATLPRVKSHADDFLQGCKGGTPPACNFDYAARLTEIVLLGNVACRAGEKITYDFKTGKSSSQKANALLKREPRKGWEFGYA